VYDLVNTAREVLAQLSTPVLLNFSMSLERTGNASSSARINETGALYITLLTDLDRLLATDTAFMLGPWIASARKLGGNATDCVGTRVAKLDAGTGRCDDFMDWNARAQLTSWYPTLSADASYPGQQNGRDHDYAGKQWSGLINGIYVPRAELYRTQALRDAKAGVAFNSCAALKDYARMTYNWQTGFENVYPVEPVGDAVAESIALRKKYSPYFSACAGPTEHGQ
jgi:alpha-N-acetylglucosaminidase